MTVTVRPLEAADQAAWRDLWAGYITFYEADVPEAVSALTWERLFDPAEPLHGAVATLEGDPTPIGLVHWLTHRSTWSATTYAYLEDLFVSPTVRGGGVGRALIEHVYDWARGQNCTQVYWLTHQTNTTAMALYDRIATRTGFVHYAKAVEG